MRTLQQILRFEVLLCENDHSKLGQTANFISGNVTDFDVIVTDREADTEFLGELALDYKIKTIVADLVDAKFW